MQQLLQSAFLQALSHSLIASIWQMALLWFACIALLKLFKFTSAQKFNIAFIAQFSGLIAFVYTFFYAYTNLQQTIVAPVFNTTVPAKINSVIIEYMPYAASIYLCVLLYKLAKLGIVYKESNRLKKYTLKKISAENRIFVQQMSALLSLHKKVNIYLSEKIICPLTIGFLKPVILIPLAAVNHLTTEQMQAVILHELAHIKRADYLLFILQSVTDKIFFFNIFSKMLSNIIERERENACDDWVLQFRYNSMHYAEALFKLGRLKALPVLAMPLSGKKESLLLVRIKRLLHNPQNKTAYNLHSVLCGLLSIIIVAFLLTFAVVKPVQQKSIRPANSIAGNKINKINTASDYEAGSIAEKQKDNNTVKRNNAVKTKISRSVKKIIEQNIEQTTEDVLQNELALKQDYIVQVQQRLDSLRSALPQYTRALNSQVLVTPEVLQKAVSYQNFKQLENMLAASGDSIKITETTASKNSYQKEITIVAKDKNGNKHIYTVIVELYQ